MTPRTVDWICWECERCHREVVELSVTMDLDKPAFELRCPLCDQLVRFVTPTLQELTAPGGDSVTLRRSNAEVREVH